jgi:acetyl esterase/lipase
MVKSTIPLAALVAVLFCCGCESIKTNIEYGRVHGHSLLLDAHVPDGKGLHPVVILVHGGGWTAGDKYKVYAIPSKPLTDANFTWFSIDYRLAEGNKDLWPACFEDELTAIRWVKKHATEYKGDPNRIALMGYSAGGHLVCYAAVMAEEDTRVQAIVGCAPPTDLNLDVDLRGHKLSKALQKLLNHSKVRDEATRKLLYDMSPINYVKPGLPPFLIIHGDHDSGVPYQESINFVAKLKENGVPVEFFTIHGADHNILKWDNFDPTYQGRMVDWLNKTLGGN